MTQAQIHDPVIFCCSPRAGGNSDGAGEAFARGVREAGGQVRVVHLRKYRIQPCIGCNRCLKDPEFRCFQEGEDDVLALFTMLLHARFVTFASPIFFYHVPALFKAFIDRGQSYYLRRASGDPYLRKLPERKAYAVMVAGRPRGEKLFEGVRLTLKSFLPIFNIALQPALEFRGIDLPGDLTGQPGIVSTIQDAGAAAWKAHHK